MTRFRNPHNGYTVRLGRPFLWCLLFGAFYFAIRGIWPHALFSLILALMTGGISWLIYPFFARRIIRKHYLERGWAEYDDSFVPLLATETVTETVS
jgi:uncharacterized protein (DUF58 family)